MELISLILYGFLRLRLQFPPTWEGLEVHSSCITCGIRTVVPWIFMVLPWTEAAFTWCSFQLNLLLSWPKPFIRKKLPISLTHKHMIMHGCACSRIMYVWNRNLGEHQQILMKNTVGCWKGPDCGGENISTIWVSWFRQMWTYLLWPKFFFVSLNVTQELAF